MPAQTAWDWAEQRYGENAGKGDIASQFGAGGDYAENDPFDGALGVAPGTARPLAAPRHDLELIDAYEAAMKSTGHTRDYGAAYKKTGLTWYGYNNMRERNGMGRRN